VVQNKIKYYVEKKYNGNQEKISVAINVIDECENGHPDFSMTATIYELNEGRWRWIGGGCCHKKILEHWPEFKIFAELHLSDYKGAPMYAVENGFYWIKKYKTGEDVNTAKKYLRVTEEELATLSLCEDKNILWYRLYDLGIVKRWEEEAQEAIKYLEELSGRKFLPNSQKSHISPLPEEIKTLIEERIANGYYLSENIRKREAKLLEEKKQKRINELKEKAEKDIKEINDKLSVHVYVVESGVV
jgi:hypothetical protein